MSYASHCFVRPHNWLLCFLRCYSVHVASCACNAGNCLVRSLLFSTSICGIDTAPLCSVCAVTRNRAEAPGPASAAPAASVPLSGLEDLIMEQPDDNATDVDAVPSPELQDPLPPGQTLLPLVVCIHY